MRWVGQQAWKRLLSGWIALALLVPVAVVGAGSAAAAGTPLSAMLIRDSQFAQYREQGLAGASISASGRGSYSDGTLTSQVVTFNVTVGNQLDLSVTLSADLAPGSYQTSRTPGAPVILSTSAMPCGGSAPGTLTVLEASYADNGTPTRLTASFDIASCDSLPARHGELRWNSTVALGVLVAPDSTALSTPVMVNSTADLPVQLTARGNAPVTAGAAVLHQRAMADGRMIWTILHDGCAGHTLSPGQSCTVVLRLAPVRPDGYPEGNEDAWLSVPDGHSQPAWAPFSGKVVPLPGQPLGLTVEGAFRHLVLRWAEPYSGEDRYSTSYRVYRIDPSGARQLIATTAQSMYLIAGLPDRFSATYTVTAQSIGHPEGAAAVPATGTTASRELLYLASDGPFNQQWAPSATGPQSLAFTGQLLTSGMGNGNLAVSRNQATVAWSAVLSSLSYIVSGSTDGTIFGFSTTPDPSAPATPQWDVDPAVSPDGSRIVYTHSATSDDPATVLRIAGRTAGASPIDVPGSAGLTDAVFDATGAGLVAVRHTDSGTELVHLDPSSGNLSTIGNSAGLSEPDVSASGQIIAVAATDAAHPAASELVSIAGPGSPARSLPGTGANWHPQFSRDGATVYYLHRDDALTENDHVYGHGAQLVIATGLSGPLGSSLDAPISSPYLLTEDGQHRTDSTAPTVRLLSPSGPTVVLGSLATAHWAGADPVLAGAVTSGLASYDARYRVAGPNGARSAYAYPPAWQHTSSTVGSVQATAGISYCFSARARDRSGNVSTWTADSCASSPLDDRAFISSAARSPANPAYYRSSYSMAAKAGVSFSRSAVTATRLAVLVQTCPTCGSLDVWIGSRYAGRVRAYAPTTHYRQLLWLIVPRSTGALVLRAASAAPIRLDGVAIVN